MEVDRLTIPEYNLLMRAVQAKEVDKDYRNHLQAFLNFSVKAERKVGKDKSKPVYSTFKKFYDFESEMDKALHPEKAAKNRFARLGKFLKKGE